MSVRLWQRNLHRVDRILITGISALGFHGVLPEEQSRAQPFEVDVELGADLGFAGGSDSLGDTIDYAGVTEAVVRVITSERHQLLEKLATRIAESCKADPRVSSVVVTVRKMRPPIAAIVGHVAVRIER